MSDIQLGRRASFYFQSPEGARSRANELAELKIDDLISLKGGPLSHAGRAIIDGLTIIKKFDWEHLLKAFLVIASKNYCWDKWLREYIVGDILQMSALPKEGSSLFKLI